MKRRICIFVVFVVFSNAVFAVARFDSRMQKQLVQLVQERFKVNTAAAREIVVQLRRKLQQKKVKRFCLSKRGIVRVLMMCRDNSVSKNEVANVIVLANQYASVLRANGAPRKERFRSTYMVMARAIKFARDRGRGRIGRRFIRRLKMQVRQKVRLTVLNCGKKGRFGRRGYKGKFWRERGHAGKHGHAHGHGHGQNRK